MGADNQPRERQARRASHLKRGKAKRDPLDVVLIVCEGEKTEPLYLEDLRDDLGLNRANVTITGDCGSSPDAIVEEAIRRFDQDPEFDRVYCVFDRDRHSSYENACDRIRTKTLRKGGRGAGKAIFRAITSVPCFEYWLLLHYKYETSPFQETGRHSPCDAVIAKLKREALPDYEKGLQGVYERTSSHIQQGIVNAQRALESAEQTGTDNPTTRVHELVEDLFKLSQRKNNAIR
jgi:hypothetical protein